MSEKFEKLLDLLVNEEKAKAEDLFHEIVVDKSREIYEELVSNDAETETIEEKKEEDKEVDETKKEDESKEEVDEKADPKADEDKEVDETKKEDESKEEVDETEAIETIGGDATDDLVADITADQVGGEPVQAEEDMTQDELEDKVLDLEDALDELKAEFAAMNGDDEYGDDENGEPELDVEIDPEADPEAEPEMEFPAPEEEAVRRPFEGKEKTGDKAQTVEEHLKEYSEMVKADMSGDDDGGAKKSPVAGKNDMGGTAANIAKGSSEEKGGATPKSESSSEKYANRPGGTSKSMTSPAPKPKDDKGDASAKSPVGPGK
jgi:hypothetical protein